MLLRRKVDEAACPGNVKSPKIPEKLISMETIFA
jgi:hypothetical protein